MDDKIIQVSVCLPESVVKAAREEAKARRVHDDGRKLMPSALIRAWVMLGMAAAAATKADSTSAK